MQIEFQAGATVRARGARFIVLSADTIAQAGSDPIRRLRLRALEEPFRNDEICVLHPIENVEPDEIPELDILRPGRIARFQLLMDAIRLSLAPGDDRLVSSSRSKVDFEPYQQVPALRALELPRPRLLIADDVGLGKTIEAGLILRELNARRCAARILIVSPASITEQWQTELATKFGFEFRIFDSEGVAEARRALEAGTNPWWVEPRVIASVDFIKRREGAFSRNVFRDGRAGTNHRRLWRSYCKDDCNIWRLSSRYTSGHELGCRAGRVSYGSLLCQRNNSRGLVHNRKWLHLPYRPVTSLVPEPRGVALLGSVILVLLQLLRRQFSRGRG